MAEKVATKSAFKPVESVSRQIRKNKQTNKLFPWHECWGAFIVITNVSFYTSPHKLSAKANVSCRPFLAKMSWDWLQIVLSFLYTIDSRFGMTSPHQHSMLFILSPLYECHGQRQYVSLFFFIFFFFSLPLQKKNDWISRVLFSQTCSRQERRRVANPWTLGTCWQLESFCSFILF